MSCLFLSAQPLGEAPRPSLFAYSLLTGMVLYGMMGIRANVLST